MIAYTKLMLALSSAHTPSSLPAVLELFENHVKPMADEEAYRALIRILGRAHRGDLILKYWEVLSNNLRNPPTHS